MSNVISDIPTAVQKFLSGEVGIFPTDTAFGIGCRMDNKDAVKRVYTIRNRPSEKALIVLVDSIDMAEKYVHIHEQARNLMDKYWPGGVTLILPCKTENVIPEVRADGETLAVRLPDHAQIREIIGKVGVPLVAPSANRSNEPTPYIFDDIDQSLQNEVDFVLSGVCTMKGVSTIIDTTEAPFTIARQGAVEVLV